MYDNEDYSTLTFNTIFIDKETDVFLWFETLIFMFPVSMKYVLNYKSSPTNLRLFLS